MTDMLECDGSVDIDYNYVRYNSLNERCPDMMQFKALPITRRRLIAAMPVVLLGAASSATAADAVGEAFDVRGEVLAHQSEDVRNLGNGADVLLRDLVETREASFARLDLSGGTTVHLGSQARLLIDQFIADAGGVLELGEGALLLDRAEELPKIDLTIRSRFGLIAVRGTRFFAGPSRGVFGVFVERGVVEVQAAGVSRHLEAGQGVNIPAAGEPPGEVTSWGKARIDEALASVGL